MKSCSSLDMDWEEYFSVPFASQDPTVFAEGSYEVVTVTTTKMLVSIVKCRVHGTLRTGMKLAEGK